ncbi:hypothetical protein [Alloscardovia macacae]|uniref:hypothetical protein n=1 Tax=Alloscardovia macacae TaxID=1160091 RepID=UPI0015D69236|nr:hypothetical protein [Alloscardovia macacae]
MNTAELLRHFNLTEDWIENDVARLEDENQDDYVIEPIYAGHHFDDDAMKQVGNSLMR